ncbi:LOB domain-containing protein 22 isoform X1 [Rosa rugosa]|uniref:LOB domain-containing protein 22 isoform X1 n=1 Tax=Rosa rugosa TaxID=74645 RepID=UPI002B40B97F|nr:LOB domain-containing protein 22 isoform X1 [Rosa rugosa]
MSITSGSIVTRTSSPTTPNSSSSSSTKGNGNTQACAACKYQRRKCAPDCILAPYFPHDRQRQFLNAHKLFGVSNITKIIKHLDHRDKEEAMRTIIFQSDVRASDPVGGCYRIIQELQRLIEYNKAELDIVLHQLAICRAQAQQQQQQPIMQQIPEVGDTTCADQMISVDPLSLYGNPMHFHYLQQQPNVQVTGQQDQGAPYLFVQNTNGNNGHQQQHMVPEDMNMWAMQDSMSSLHIKHGMNAGDCEDIKPFVDIACDDDQRNHEIKFQPDAIGDQSDEALLKIEDGNLKDDQQSESAAQQVHHHYQDHGDLKGEATLFMTLTNCSS